MAKYILKSGKHYTRNNKGEVECHKPGAVLELTPGQAEAFKDRFVSSKVHAAELAATKAKLEEAEEAAAVKDDKDDEAKAEAAKKAQADEEAKLAAEKKAAEASSNKTTNSQTK